MKIELQEEDIKKAVAFYLKRKLRIKGDCEIRSDYRGGYQVEFNKNLWIYKGQEVKNDQRMA